ncbi:MAG TPA: alpha-L-fucosidase, partial [Chitinophagaceae bacterium]|nr:alpha-L-fucosidase [Chitinophagaceae bacterium]
MKKTIWLLLFSILWLCSRAQQGEPPYVAPKDSLVMQKLHWWEGLKFGLLMHWGAYSQWGVVESWSICPEDEGWTQRHGHGSENYFDYKTRYEHLLTTFNPVHFDPAKWAAAAKYAGMRYLVFTTKHHDGFCMFDTKQTDYKITSDSCPFHNDPRANVTKVLFDAFRKQGFGIGAYFSKPDWHSRDFWWPYFPPLDRFPNYDEAKYPARWKRFQDFTYNQIQELMGGEYGKIDILWLDGGWVRPHSTREIAANPRVNDEVNMPRIAAMARSLQPGLIMVDRDVPGPYENYRTPEQNVPPGRLPYPWETCMTMGNSWSYVPGDHYKSVHILVQLLIRIVSRGGNFLLNIGPGPDGDLDPVAYQRLKGIGDWMAINSTAIYDTRPDSPYAEG